MSYREISRTGTSSKSKLEMILPDDSGKRPEQSNIIKRELVDTAIKKSKEERELSAGDLSFMFKINGTFNKFQYFKFGNRELKTDINGRIISVYSSKQPFMKGEINKTQKETTLKERVDHIEGPMVSSIVASSMKPLFMLCDKLIGTWRMDISYFEDTDAISEICINTPKGRSITKVDKSLEDYALDFTQKENG